MQSMRAMFGQAEKQCIKCRHCETRDKPVVSDTSLTKHAIKHKQTRNDRIQMYISYFY